jgi:hypothetical protein
VGQVLGIAVAGAMAIAFVQVSTAPPAAPAPAPSMGVVAHHVRAEFEWFRTEFPRDPRWWKGVATTSADNFRVLTTGLSEGHVPESTH